MRSFGVVVVALAVLVGGCTIGPATPSAGDASTTSLLSTTSTTVLPAAEPTTTLADPALAVVYRQAGPNYVEGSVTHVELYRYFPVVNEVPVPVVILDQDAPRTGTVLVDETLIPGTYELRSYQRPYVGRNDIVGSPEDGCSTRFTLEPGAESQAAITVLPGSACGIHIAAANVEAPILNMDLTLQPPGAPGCQPASPIDADGREVLATSFSDVVVWGLLWPPVDGRFKMVFRVTGEGDFDVVARHEDGTEIVSDWALGDGATDASNYGRPGLEWHTLFAFPTDGCWNIHFTRGGDTADIWLTVTAA